ncbi:MAG: branched-chain amino acid ABC transporter permease [Mycobacteriales bacterium]
MDLLVTLVTGLLVGGIYALVAVGLNLVFGVIRVVNFAHGEFVMLGMYGAYVASRFWGLDPYISSWLLIAPGGFLLGLLIQRFVIQKLLDEHLMQMFATFGLIIVFQNAVLAATRGEPKTVRTRASTATFDVFKVAVSGARFVVLLVAVAVSIALVVFLRRTVAGTAMRAVAQDRRTASLMGINTNRVYLLTFGLSAALAAVAGALLSPVYTATPQIGFGFVLPAFAVVVLGGLGSVAGSFVGGLLVGVVEALSGYYLDPSLKQAVWFTLFVVALVVRPAGLFGQVGAEVVGAK